MMTFVDLADIWASAIWRASWQGGVFALLVWVFCWLVPSTPARFQSWLWRLVLLKFAVALVWATPIDIPLLPAPEAAIVQTPYAMTAEPSRVDGEAAVALTTSHNLFAPILLVFVFWLVAVGCLTARILLACRAAARLRNACRCSEDRPLLRQLAAVARSFGMTGHPPVLESDGDGSPLLVGILRPAIIVPSTTLGRLADAECAMVIGHELAHLRRADLVWGLLAAVVRAAFFFHPLTWLAERRLRLSQEIAADELAIQKQRHDPVGYASLLVSVVGKLGPHRTQPALSLAAAGSDTSLKKRIVAMHYMKPVSRKAVATYTVALGLFTALGVVPWAVVAAEQAAKTDSPDKPAPKQSVDQKDKNGWGRFVSFKDGTLTVENNAGVLLVWNGITESVKAMVYDVNSSSYRQYEGTAAALNLAKPGTPVSVTAGKTMIRIGARKGQTVGTFVSFKNGRLLMLGTNLGESFTKKYGNNVHFNPFRADVPAYESVDGGEFKLIGMANKVLADVKEGTILTVHGQGDDNITRVDIGMPKTN